MSGRIRAGVQRVLGLQQVALEGAIERGDIGMQYAIAARMLVLEAALADDAWERIYERQAGDPGGAS
jgi:hypothetical protein